MKKNNRWIKFDKISTTESFMFNGARIWRGVSHLRSVSVDNGEVFLIELLPGQQLGDVNPFVAGPYGAVCICDRLGYDQETGRFTTTMIRQKLQMRSEDDDWDCCGDFFADGNDWLRRHCQSRGATLIQVPGEVTPLCYADEVLVPNFRMSGTEYYRVPKTAYERYLLPSMRQQEAS